jgi:hypothetical protein
MFNERIESIRNRSNRKVSRTRNDCRTTCHDGIDRRLEHVLGRRSVKPTTSRPSSSLGARLSSRSTPIPNSMKNLPYRDATTGNGTADANLLDENGAPHIGHLLAFTPDVIQAFQDAAKSIEESCEIKQQAMNQIRDSFNDAKAYSLTVNQSIAQKLADIITLTVRKHKRRTSFVI